MTSKHTFWLALFLAVAAVELIGEASANTTLVYITKPLLMPLLAIWFYNETANSRRFLRSSVISALGFATAGDVLLMFAGNAQAELYFLLGLGAFMFCQLFYAGGFIQTAGKNSYLIRHPWWAVPFAMYTIALLNWLWPAIPEGLHGPVAMYGLVISLMALSVMNLYHSIPAQAFNLMLAGAVFFVVSDSLIAVNKFGHPFTGARVAIMLTYILGQWLLVAGARKATQGVPDTPQADQE